MTWTPTWIVLEWFSAIDKLMIVSFCSASIYSKLMELVSMFMLSLAVTKFAPSNDISTKYFSGSSPSEVWGPSRVRFFTLMRISVGAAVFLLDFGAISGVILMLVLSNFSVSLTWAFGYGSFVSSIFSSCYSPSFRSSSSLFFDISSISSLISCSSCYDAAIGSSS